VPLYRLGSIQPADLSGRYFRSALPLLLESSFLACPGAVPPCPGLAPVRPGALPLAPWDVLVLELEEGFVAPEPEVDVFPLFVVLPAPEAPELPVPSPTVVVLAVAPPVVAPPVVVPMVELFTFLPVTEVVAPAVAPPVVVLLAAPPVAFPLLELVSPAPLKRCFRSCWFLCLPKEGFRGSSLGASCF